MENRFSIFAEDYNVPLNAWSALQEEILSKKVPQKTGGQVQLNNMLWFQKDFVIWGADKSQFEAAANFYIAKIAEDDNFLANISIIQRREIEDFKKILDVLKETNLKDKTNAELYEIYNNIYDQFVLTWVDGFAILLLEMGSVKYSEIINKNFYSKLLEIDSNYPDTVFSHLISPTEETYLKKENISVLKLVSKIQASRKAILDFNNAKSLKELPVRWRNELIKLSEEFGWLQFYYLGPVAKPEYYLDLAKRRLHIAASSELEKIIEEKNNLLIYQKDCRKHFTVSEWSQIESLKEAAYLKELRKEIHQYYQCFVMEKFYREIGRRFYLSYLQTRYILHDEFKNMLCNGQIISSDVLNERYFCTAIIWNKGKFEVQSGKNALSARDMIENQEPDKNKKKIVGSIAYPGRVKGKVKIVNSIQDISKFNDGDILVIYSTNPSLVPAMNKAAAIITDSGGVTCHAAIVARELKLPCIIGTRDATKVLKDGDIVEVDANKGIISKMEK